jgi:Ran GTPase-activating protein (RanGAP) involved in mRNA processing and transport
VLFDQAVLTLGARIEEPAAFVGRLNDLLVSLSAESTEAESTDAESTDAESTDAESTDAESTDAESPETGDRDAGDRRTAPTAEPGPDPEP